LFCTWEEDNFPKWFWKVTFETCEFMSTCIFCTFTSLTLNFSKSNIFFKFFGSQIKIASLIKKLLHSFNVKEQIMCVFNRLFFGNVLCKIAYFHVRTMYSVYGSMRATSTSSVCIYERDTTFFSFPIISFI
jgi:hypothetical protein